MLTHFRNRDRGVWTTKGWRVWVFFLIRNCTENVTTLLNFWWMNRDTKWIIADSNQVTETNRNKGKLLLREWGTCFIICCFPFLTKASDFRETGHTPTALNAGFRFVFYASASSGSSNISLTFRPAWLWFCWPVAPSWPRTFSFWHTSQRGKFMLGFTVQKRTHTL